MAQPALRPSAHPIPSTWISANAGSGKTRALVDRVLTLLLMGVTPERICCITYTKAGAGEMRSRILDALRDLLVLSDDECKKFMLERTGHTHDLALARSLFARVLDSPLGGLQLTTIHGFCQQLLRRFPLEAELSPQFTVMEEADSDNLQRIARQRLLEHAEGELAEALALIADRGGEHAFNELMRNAARQAEWWKQEGERYPLSEHLRDALHAHFIPLPAGGGSGWGPMGRMAVTQSPHAPLPTAYLLGEEQVRRACCSDLIPIENKPALRAALSQFTKRDAEFVPALTHWLETDDVEIHLPLLDDFYDWFFTKAGELRKNPFTKDTPEREIMEAIAARYIAMVERCRTVSCIEESIAAAIVSRAFLREYEQLKTEYQSLDYDDLVLRTEQLLREYGGWVMSKLDHRIDHLLVDEAQDTSPGQWRIVRTLVDELMASNQGVGSGNLPRSLLVVGDEKQSIFSFQGADPKQFFSEKGFFGELLENSGSTLETRELKESYRSARAVLDLVDAVAQLRPVARALSASGVVTKHILTKKDAVGRVVLHPPGEKKGKEEITPFTIPTEYLISKTPPQVLATRIAGEIKQWLAEGKCTPGDILILLWRRQPFADCLIRALEQEEIPVAGIDRLKLAEHLAVRDLMALMNWCGYPDDDLALAHVLRSPVVGIDEATLENLAHGRADSLWQAVQTQAGVAQQLAELLSRRTASPYDFLTHVLEVTAARTRFSERFGEEVHEVLDELKSQAASMPRSMPATIAAFHDWITRSERDIKRQQETQSTSVRIMTVHGAKGLEAPIVLLINPIKKPDTGRETSLQDEQTGLPLIAFSDDGKRAAAYADAKANRKQSLFNEYYRLLYVALTRARDELHIFTAEPSPAKEDENEKSWYALVADAMAILPTMKEGDTVVLQDPGIRMVKPKPTGEAAPLLPAWAHTAPTATTRAGRILSPSRLITEAFTYGMATQPGANIRGVRIHRVLQFLNAASDRAQITQLLQMADPVIRDDEIHEIEKLHAQERWLWENPSYPEVNIGGTVAGHRFGGQIDRLVIAPEAVIIVDYKTGSHVPATAGEVSESYRLQLKIYRELLRQLYPGKAVRAALLWTSAPKLMWLDSELDRTPLPNMDKI